MRASTSDTVTRTQQMPTGGTPEQDIARRPVFGEAAHPPSTNDTMAGEEEADVPPSGAEVDPLPNAYKA